MIGIFIIWSSYFNDSFSQNSGYSPFTLLIFYIFGAYIGKYMFFQENRLIKRMKICFICINIFFIISLISYYFNTRIIISKFCLKLAKLFKVRINTFPTIIQVFSITIFIAQIKFNKFISKIITFIGPLTFDVYLIHENRSIRKNYIIKYFNELSINLKLRDIYLIIFKKTFIIFITCIIIAFIRNFIFKILKVKIICYKFESITTKIINNWL